MRERGHRPLERRTGLGRAAPGRLRPFGQAHPRRDAGAGVVEVAVIISDTFGRPWRRGLTDVAIGVSGIAAVVDLRDTTDALGRVLQVTEVAVADEIASAAELVMGKSTSVPVAIVRGFDPSWLREGSVRELIRPTTKTSSGDTDTVSAVPAFVEARRSIRAFLPDVPARAELDAIVEAACLAPAPHHSRPWRFVVVDTDDAKQALAHGMGERWRRDLTADGVPAARVDELVDASHDKLVRAPAFVVGCLTWDGLDRYPDERRQRAEWGMALLSLGAAVENLMLAATDREPRVVLGRRADLLPRRSARRARPPGRVAAPRARARRHARPGLRRPAPPAGPARRDPPVPLTRPAGRSSDETHRRRGGSRRWGCCALRRAPWVNEYPLEVLIDPPTAGTPLHRSAPHQLVVLAALALGS